MSDFKTVVLSGGELKVDELGGKNTVIVNFGSAELYASAYPGIVPDGDSVAAIPAGGAVNLRDTYGTVYLLGTGKVQLMGTDYATVNVGLTVGGSGGGETPGGDTMPYTDGLNNIFIPDNFDAENQRWYNSAHSNYFATANAARDGGAVSFGTNAHGFVNIDIPTITYVIVRLNQFAASSDFVPVMSKRLTDNQPVVTYDFLGTARDNTLRPYFTGGLVADNDFFDFAVYCFQHEGRDACFYANGVLVGHHLFGDDVTDNYYGEYLLNRKVRGSNINAINPCGSAFKMIAFGTKNHTNEQVKANCEWLMKKYLEGD